MIITMMMNMKIPSKFWSFQYETKQNPATFYILGTCQNLVNDKKMKKILRTQHITKIVTAC